MKTKLILLSVLAASTLALRAEIKPEAAPQPVAVSDETATTLKKILRKLDDMELRLDRIEKAQAAEAGIKRKVDTMERDLGDVRRSVQRLESKR